MMLNSSSLGGWVNSQQGAPFSHMELESTLALGISFLLERSPYTATQFSRKNCFLLSLRRREHLFPFFLPPPQLRSAPRARARGPFIKKKTKKTQGEINSSKRAISGRTTCFFFYIIIIGYRKMRSAGVARNWLNRRGGQERTFYVSIKQVSWHERAWWGFTYTYICTVKVRLWDIVLFSFLFGCCAAYVSGRKEGMEGEGGKLTYFSVFVFRAFFCFFAMLCGHGAG